jgi:AcrR family transcriptional regulator
LSGLGARGIVQRRLAIDPSNKLLDSGARSGVVSLLTTGQEEGRRIVPRVRKDADVRRNELLDVVLGLCVSQGFEGLSIEQITGAAGVAKGTFYYYFESKRDVLEQLVQRFGEQHISFIDAEMRKVEGNALQKLHAMVDVSTQAWERPELGTAMSFLMSLYDEDNYLVRQRVYSAWFEHSRPLYIALVQQGAREGTFDVADPDATTDVLLTISLDAANRVWERSLRIADPEARTAYLIRAAQASLTAQERILGIPPGTLNAGVTEALGDVSATYFASGGPEDSDL